MPKDMEARNCRNFRGISDEGRAVTEYTAEVVEELKGHSKVFGLKGLRLYECPVSYITAETWEIIRLACLVENTGHLLYAGGIGDQPYWMIETLEMLKTEEAKHLKDGKPDGR